MTMENTAAAEVAVSQEQIELLKQQYKKKSQIAAIWFRYRKNKMALFGLAIFCVMLIISLTAPLFIDYDAQVVQQSILDRFQGPSQGHIFGTDHFGRDIFARVIWGSRISMFVGVGAIAISLTIGSTVGAAAGFFGGTLDDVLMRVMDIFLAIPETLLAISIVAAMGNSIPNLLLALSVGQIPKMSRIVRSSVMTLKRQEFIEAARACGTSNARIILRHIIPNALGPIIVNSTLTVARSILSIASLSFIGLGIQPPAPEWGAMLSEAKTRLIEHSYLVYAPGIAIILTVMSLTMIGDGLRDALDPKMKN